MLVIGFGQRYCCCCLLCKINVSYIPDLMCRWAVPAVGHISRCLCNCFFLYVVMYWLLAVNMQVKLILSMWDFQVVKFHHFLFKKGIDVGSRLHFEFFPDVAADIIERFPVEVYRNFVPVQSDAVNILFPIRKALNPSESPEIQDERFQRRL